MAISNIAMKNFREGSTYFGWTALSSSAYNMELGYYLSNNYVIGLRFTTDTTISALNIRFCADNSDITASSSYSFRYKVCTSESALNNCANYNHNNTGDGTFSINPQNWAISNLTISGTRTAGTYYVAIWRATSNAKVRAYWTNTSPYSSYPNRYSSVSATNAATYTVSYNANGGTGAPAAQTKTQGVNLTLSSTKPTRGNSSSSSNFVITGNANGGNADTSCTATKTTTTSYSFAHWSDNQGATYSAGGTYTKDYANTLTAQWSSSSSDSYSGNTLASLPKPVRSAANTGSYTVSFGGDGTPSSSSLSATITTYYSFAGWSGYTDSSAFYSAATVYATWNSSNSVAAITLPTATRGNDSVTGYTVSFDGNGGNNASTQTSTKTRKYTHTGWTTTAGGAAQWAANTSYTPASSHWLYAAWSYADTNNAITLPAATSRANAAATGYKVTFNANGGSCSTTELTASRTTSYTFGGWNTKSDGTGTNYGASASYTPSATTTLYAKWNSSTSTSAITLPTATRTGYTFKGWSTSSTATSGSTGSYTPSGATTLYAIWEIKKYTLTLNKGTGVASFTGAGAYDYGTNAPTIATASTGYHLTKYSGNNTDNNAQEWAISGNPKTHENTWAMTTDRTITVYAEPDAVIETYTVSYDANGGTGAPSAQTKTHGVDLTLSNTKPTKSGYTFLGWGTSASDTTVDYALGGTYSENADITLYAIWIPMGRYSTLYIGDQRIGRVYFGETKIGIFYF